MLLLGPLEDDILLPSSPQESPSTTMIFQSIFYSGLDWPAAITIFKSMSSFRQCHRYMYVWFIKIFLNFVILY